MVLQILQLVLTCIDTGFLFIINFESHSDLQLNITINIMNLVWRGVLRAATRKLIQPQSFQISPFDDSSFHITSKTYQFSIGKKPLAQLLYEHDCSTPAAVLKKPGVHILPESMPEVNKRQKFTAVRKQLQESFSNSFRNCKTPKEIFHLERKIRFEIRSKLYFIGCLDGRKHRHLLKYSPYMELLAQNTQKEYEKNGVHVDALGEKIYPLGKVWLPTSQKYLFHYQRLLSGITGKPDPTFLDIGCGTGVLSFLFAKQFKKGKLFALDKNPDAVKTCNINAARLEYRNVEAFEFDVTKEKDFLMKSQEMKLPKSFDWIVVNPPWLISSKIEGESPLTEGVYDHSAMLLHSLRLAKRILSPEGKLILIYSDLSEILGLSPITLDRLCVEQGWVIEQRHEEPLAQEMVKRSALSEFKARSKILTCVLRKS